MRIFVARVSQGVVREGARSPLSEPNRNDK